MKENPDYWEEKERLEVEKHLQLGIPPNCILNKCHLELQGLALGKGARTVVPSCPLQECVGRRQAGIRAAKRTTVTWLTQGVMHNSVPGSVGSAARSTFSYFKAELGAKAGQREEL